MERDYEENRKELLKINLLVVITYYEKYWHPIRYDGVEGLKLQNLTFQNRTSNRLESVNQKIKTVCKKRFQWSSNIY